MLRNLVILAKHAQRQQGHAPQHVLLLGNAAFTRRQVRRLPRQKVEYKALTEGLRLTVPASTEEAKQDQLQQTGDQDSVDESHQLAGTLRGKRDNNLAPVDDLSMDSRVLLPTFNLASYVNKSETLQQLIQLGVDLHAIERRKGLPEFVLKLQFDQDVKPYLLFLKDQGVPAKVMGEWFTKNPLICKVDMDDLLTRVNYMEAKRFSPKQRSRIITVNPYWLMFSTKRIDRRLGHFQQEFKLSGDDVRFLAAKQPKLITYNMEHIRKSTFCIREEMGFDKDELKCLLLSKPKLWMLNSDELIERFAYAHQEMGLSHDMLIKFPEVLTSREFRLRQRHEFLRMLGRAQYDPEHDLYVSPKAVVEGTDWQFARNVAKTDMATYELFLKTR